MGTTQNYTLVETYALFTDNRAAWDNFTKKNIIILLDCVISGEDNECITTIMIVLEMLLTRTSTAACII